MKVMVVTLMLVRVCWGWGEESKERVNIAAENVKTKAEEIKQSADGSWSDSGFDKIPE